MKIRLIKLIILFFSIMALASCATSGSTKGANGKGQYAVVDDGSGATVAGAGNGGDFNGQSAYAAKNLMKKHVVYFPYDSNVIEPWALKPLNANLPHANNPHPVSQQVISAYANYLLNHPGAVVRLEGNTDARGTREYNIALGERRANAVAQALELAGVSPKQISVISYGKEKPVALGQDEADYSQNRRVQMQLEG